MHADRDLSGLAARKVALRRRIALTRTQCVAGVTATTQPLVRLDHMVSVWRNLSPLARAATVSIGALAMRTVFRRRRIVHQLARWVPLLLGVARGAGSVVTAWRGAAHHNRRSAGRAD